MESIGDVVSRIRAGVAQASEPGSDRARLARLAAEFESMLLLQMLKEMRKAGSWVEDGGEKEKGYGAETMLETIDAELAGHLARVQGFGLGPQLLKAFEAMNPEVATSPAVALEAAPKAAEPLREVAVLETPAGPVTSGFGWRQDPLEGTPRFHRGIDIRAAYGEDVPAAGAGRVVSAGLEGGYGQTVVVEHAGGLRTRYAHLSALLVAPGDQVRDGQVLGRAGRSGRATGTHLHFEVVAPSGMPLDPVQFARFKAAEAGADSTHVNTPVVQETRSDDFTN
jgi:murein DD-endopeptidase MepM/ murein hydrolase activator NlpD